jgi:hypothetical protein
VKASNPVALKTRVEYWWEVYRTLLVTPTLRDYLGLTRQWNETTHRYIDWDMKEETAESMRYDEWWEEHPSLFFDADFPVSRIMSDHLVRNPNILYLAINAKWSTPTRILKEVRSHIDRQTKSIKRQKGKTRSHGEFRFTPGAEIRPAAYNRYIHFLKEVFAPNCERRQIELRKIAQIRFKGREELLNKLHLGREMDGSPDAYISIYRYRKKVISLCRAVARGEFPGSER